MKNVFRFLTLFFISCVLFISCSSDDDGTIIDDEPLPQGAYENGVFILNEGNFGAANTSVSFIDEAGEIHHTIFNIVNGTGLGDTAQSMTLIDDKAYIVLHSSNTIEVVNRYTFESLATISVGLIGPRFITFVNDKGYVSNWGDPGNPNDDFIAVINLDSNTVESSISVVEGPEKMLSENGNLYVAHKGGYGFGNSISVINTVTSGVSASIPVTDVPDAMVKNNGFLYVLSSGKPAWSGEETQGALTKINLSNNGVLETAMFEEGLHPTHLKIHDNSLYFTIDSGVYKQEIDASIPSSPLFSLADQGVYGIYGLDVVNNQIFVADAKDFSSNGEAFVYSLNGALENSFSTGIIPNGFYFNE